MNARRLHLILTGVWAILVIPTILWWKDSILFIGIVSVYANVVSHWGSYQAAKAERAVTKSQESG